MGRVLNSSHHKNLTNKAKHDIIRTSKGKKGKIKMAVIKMNGYIIDIVKASEIDVKKVEAAGFVVIIK